MRSFILSIFIVLLSVIGAQASDENVRGKQIQTCSLVFTNVTTVSAGATSCSGSGCNYNCVVDARSAESIFYEWVPNATTHGSSNWDIEVWTMDTSTGQAKYYTDIVTNGDALASVGGDATTQYDVSNPSGDTFRYTWDETGTSPAITGTNPTSGYTVAIAGFNAANNGVFVVTASQGDGAGGVADYFEIYNPSGVAETNVTSATVNIGTNVTGSMGLTTGHKYHIPKISSNDGTRVDETIVITVTK